jgi:uncharacterized protein (TIGR02598 family)
MKGRLDFPRGGGRSKAALSSPVNRSRQTFPCRAFSLTEVVIAIGVAAFCLIAIFGMIPAGLNSNQASLRETLSASLTSAIVSDLRATPVAAAPATSSIYRITLPSAGSSATTAFFLNEDGATNDLNDPAVPPTYRAAVVVTSPTNRSASTARIFLSWPALASPSASGLPTNFTDSFETVVGLDRN